MALARLFTTLGDLIIRRLGDTGGPPSSRVSSELDNIIAWANLEADRTLYTNISVGTLSNSTTETSLFSLVTASTGSSRQVPGNSAIAGTAYRLYVYGSVNSTGTPNITFRAKYGATTLSTTTGALANNTAGHFQMVVEFLFHAVGASGTMAEFHFFEYAATANGAVTPLRISGGAGTVGSLDTTSNKDLDLTFQFGTANAANNINPHGVYLTRLR